MHMLCMSMYKYAYVATYILYMMSVVMTFCHTVCTHSCGTEGTGRECVIEGMHRLEEMEEMNK